MSSQERTVYNLQDYGIKRGVSFGHYRYIEAKPHLENHIHSNILEICFCIKGQQYYIIKGEQVRLQGNEFVIVPPNTAHSTGDFPEGKGELYWVQISIDEDLGKLCNMTKREAKHLLDLLLSKSSLVFKGTFLVKPILEKIKRTLHKPQSIISEITINQLFTQLLLETLELASKEQKVSISDRLNKIDHFIQENTHRTIYLDELADLINVSEAYFKSWFKEKAGMPPKEYINRMKIDKSKTELIEKKSVTEVAFSLGFSSSQYFATTFKKYTGISPRSYLQGYR
ncbi:hypothetical protein GCM10007049_01070 [Echinicola pacifica]|uniref:HTH araC/xylS-type domain-containing protein n=1 Tax=Echinicola pacifica TaxID=346377 RepID=A0A918PJF3_9BACT|nr:helix-turn-helix domain-containing protein [Echinicola pacifica]GGZ13094.1 hypothetical protein GCM10007049_01070 [Echinicola pacifica]